MGAPAPNCTVLTLGTDQQHLLVLHGYLLHSAKKQKHTKLAKQVS